MPQPQLPLQSDRWKIPAPPNAVPLQTRMMLDLLKRIKESRDYRSRFTEAARLNAAVGSPDKTKQSLDLQNSASRLAERMAALQEESSLLRAGAAMNTGNGPVPGGFDWKRQFPPGTSWETPSTLTPQGRRRPFGTTFMPQGRGNI